MLPGRKTLPAPHAASAVATCPTFQYIGVDIPTRSSLCSKGGDHLPGASVGDQSCRKVLNEVEKKVLAHLR